MFVTFTQVVPISFPVTFPFSSTVAISSSKLSYVKLSAKFSSSFIRFSLYAFFTVSFFVSCFSIIISVSFIPVSSSPICTGVSLLVLLSISSFPWV